MLGAAVGGLDRVDSYVAADDAIDACSGVGFAACDSGGCGVFDGSDGSGGSTW